MNNDTLLRMGGVIQLAILTASALVPGKLQWRAELGKLPPLSRQLRFIRLMRTYSHELRGS
jgi:hypothetical protein